MRLYSLPPVQNKVSLTEVVGTYSHGPHPEGDGLMESMRAFLGTERLFYVSSGRTALWLIMKALSALRPKKEVLVPAYTCPAIPAAILKAGLKPVLVDMDLTDFGFEHHGPGEEDRKGHPCRRRRSSLRLSRGRRSRSGNCAAKRTPFSWKTRRRPSATPCAASPKRNSGSWVMRGSSASDEANR